MPRHTPRARPSSAEVEAVQGPGARLSGGVSVVVAGSDYSFGVGNVMIGRATSCDVTLDDPLVSREHAKITVTDDDVVIVDLGSANGTLVNEGRVLGPTPLSDGDRILVGTRELSVFGSSDSAVQRTSAVRPEPASAPEDSSRFASTQRADAFRLVGRLADKMLSLGKGNDAERVMSDHLNKILHGARANVPVPADVLASAGAYAIKLACATRRGRWVDYALELHTLANAPMAEDVVDGLCEAVRVVDRIDASRLADHRQMLRSVQGRLSPVECMVAARVLCLEVKDE